MVFCSQASSLRLLSARPSKCSWLSQALKCLGFCRQYFLQFKNKGSHPLSPHACLPPPESSLLVPAVATVRSGFLGNCCHGDPVLSYWANASHLYPYLVCDRNADKTVMLKVLHLSPLPCKLVYLGPHFLVACTPSLPSSRSLASCCQWKVSPGQLRTRRSALHGLNVMVQIW